MVHWNDGWHVIFNGLATLVFAAAVAWVLSPAARHVLHGWMSKFLWFLALATSMYVAGFYLPLGPLFVLREARRVARTAPDPTAVV